MLETAGIVAMGLTGFYLLLVVLEIAWSQARGVRVYTLKESLACASTGLLHQLWTSLIPLTAKMFVLNLAWQVAPIQFEAGWLHFAVAFLLTDLFYYLQHRLNHSVDFFWSFHQAHHSSQELNLLTGVRVSWVMPLFSALFFAPLGLFGFNPEYILLSLIIIYYGQWWCHTQLIHKLGPLEWVLNTPAAHRVHHAVDREVCNANYAGLLIIWDRLLGTYTEETEQVTVFGTEDGFVGYNPFVINLRGFVRYVSDRLRRPEPST